MQKNILFTILILVFIAPRCRSSKQTMQEETSSPSADSSSAVSRPGIAQPTKITQNISAIEAVVDTIVIVTELQYDAHIFLNSSTPIRGTMSVAEAGQRLVVSPQFVADEHGQIDVNNPLNKSLLSLRSAKPGQSFKGRISINRRGGWVLLGVEDH